MRLKIAVRNTIRNQRRTLLNLFMIMAGVTAIVLFKGFADNQLYTLRESLITTDLGHVQVAKRAFWDQTEENPKDALLVNPGALIERIQKEPGVKSVSGRISFFGLLSAKDRTTSARGLGFDPVHESEVIRGFLMNSGRRLEKADGAGPVEAMVGAGLASKIGAKTGDTVTVLTHTYDGTINALDAEVVGVFQNGVAEVDNFTFVISLPAAQKLLDTDSVEKIVATLNTTEATTQVMNSLKRTIASEQPDLQFKPWSVLSRLYQEVEEYYRVYNGIIRFIIVSLVLVGILNTVGMSIFERTGEIGTIRSLGETRRSVILQFVLEGGVLGVMGAVSGVIAATLVAWILNIIKIPVTIPGASRPWPVMFQLEFSTYFDAFVITIVTTVLASLIPSVRASRMNIVEALKRNI